MKKTITIAMLFLYGIVQAQIIPLTIIETIPEVICPGDTIEARFTIAAPLLPSQVFEAACRLDKGSITVIDTIFTGTLGQLTVVDTLISGLVYGQKFKTPVALPAGTWYASGNILSPNQVAIVVNPCISPQITSYGPDSVCVGDTICVNIYNPNKHPFYFTFRSTGPTPVYTWIDITPAGDEMDTVNYCFVVPENLDCGLVFIGINFEDQERIYVKCFCAEVGIKEYELDRSSAPIYFDLMGNVIQPRTNELMIEQRGRNRRKVVIQ